MGDKRPVETESHDSGLAFDLLADATPIPWRKSFPLRPRVAATIMLVPFSFGVAMFLFGVSLESEVSSINHDANILISVYLATLTAIAGNLLIWGAVVRWTPLKVVGTIFTLTATALIATFASLFASGIGGSGLGVVVAIGVVCILGSVSVVLLHWIWWSPPHARALHGRVPCPQCGYDLTGNVSGRCPECGCATKSLGKEECEVGP